jgi:uncharacterized membrane protein YdbT with pleckstrin-like domain
MKDQLRPDEEILYTAHPTKITLVPLIVATVVLVVATILLWSNTGEFFILVGGFILVTIALIYLAVKLIVLASFDYILTDRRVVKQTGIVNKSSVDSYLDKINNVEHRQTLWGRLLGYGDVVIDTASESGTTNFASIADPLSFKRAILEATDSYRSARSGGVRAISSAEKLRDLKALLDDGLISAEEYEATRKKLLEEY